VPAVWAAIIKGKEEYGGGWVCFKRKDGCGAKFPDGDKSIESQVVGDVDNSDLPDLWNTIIKMARKRAIVDAVLLVTGASALFTQDVADDEKPEPESVEGPPFGTGTADTFLKQTHGAIAYVLAVPPDDPAIAAALERVKASLGKVGFGNTQPYLPFAAAAGICGLASELKARREPAPTPIPRNGALSIRGAQHTGRSAYP
jgi:hypothetical protein